MKEIDADVVIANLFALGRQKVTFYELKVLQKAIEQVIPELFILIDHRTLNCNIDTRPDMFSHCEDGICRGSWSKPEGYIKNAISQLYLPGDAKAKTEQYLVSLLDKGLADDFQHIFTLAYVEKNFNYQIPPEFRDEVLSIIKKHFDAMQ